MFGRGGKDLATDAAGDILELTPKQRADASKDIVKMGPGKKSSVAEELPSYLKEQGGIIQSTKKIKQQAQQSLDDAGKEIDDVLTSYEKNIQDFESHIDPANKNVMFKHEGGKMVIDPNTPVTGNLSVDDLSKQNLVAGFARMKGESGKFKFTDLADDIGKGVDELRGVVGYEPQLAKLDKHLDKLRQMEPMTSIRDLHSYRKATDKLIKSFTGIGKTTSADALLQDALIKTRRKMSDHIQDVMLNTKKFSQDLLDQGLIDGKKFEEMSNLQDRIYKANRNYKLASYVDSQIDQAIGRKDARKMFGLTDWILAAQGLHSPVATAAGLTAKKVGEVVRPRAQLYAKEIGGAVGDVAQTIKNPALQQTIQPAVTEKKKPEITEEDNNSFVQDYSKLAGTKYAQVFEGMNEHQKAVRNSLLHQTDQDYRQIMMDKEE